LTDDADVDKAIATVDAKLDDLDEVDEANEIVEAAEANDPDKAIESEVADDANEVNKAITVDEAVVADEFDKIDEIGTGFFGINNNQLGILKVGCLSPCSFMIRFVCGDDENNNQPVSFEK